MHPSSSNCSNRSASNIAYSPGSPDSGAGTLIVASRRSALSVILSVMVGGIMHPLSMQKPRIKARRKLRFQRAESFPFRMEGTSFTCTYAEYRAGSETKMLVATWLLNSRTSAVHT